MKNKTLVNVKISLIFLCAKGAIENINFGRGYKINKVKLDDFEYNEIIFDKNERIISDYLASTLTENETKYIYCLNKNDSFYIPEIDFYNEYCVTEKLPNYEYLEDYKEKELLYINNVFILMKIFKLGAIGYKDAVFEFSYRTLLINNKLSSKIKVADALTFGNIYSINFEEAKNLSTFIKDNHNSSVLILRDVLTQFDFSLKNIDNSSKFKNLITTLEMIFIKHGENCKKEILSKRIAVFLKTQESDINILYKKIRLFYQFRSVSTHEGKVTFTKEHLEELENISRDCLKKLINICNKEFVINNSVTWNSIKNDLIVDLKNNVESKNEQGAFNF